MNKKLQDEFVSFLDDREVMKDMIKTVWKTMTPSELAQSIREGLISMDELESEMRKTA